MATRNDPHEAGYDIADIMDIMQKQETEPWPAHEGARAVEEGYRRGYLDGWEQGVEAVFRMMNDRNFSAMDACLVADAHHARKLIPWRNAAHPDVLGHPLFAITCHEPYDWAPKLPWHEAIAPSSRKDDGEE